MTPRSASGVADRPLSRSHRSRGAALVLSAAIALAAVAPAAATENGLNHYPNGVNTVLPGLAPPPGKTEFFNYDEYYTADSFVDANGKSEVPNFHLDVSAIVLRVLHTYRFSASHFTFSSAVVQPVLNVALSAAGHGQTVTGLGDTTITPLYANYASPDHKVFGYAGFDVYVPTGLYKASNIANTGLNRFTYMPVVAFTWIPNSRAQTSIEITQENNQKNPATNYYSGSSIAADGAFDYAPIKANQKFHAGLQTYFFQQLTNDTIDGQPVNGGSIGRAVGVGPQVRFDVPGGGFVLKYQHELAVQNRPKGDRYWFQFALPL